MESIKNMDFNKSYNKIDFSKSYISELYCKNICGNCYNFGCDWDIRCNENNKPINQVVNSCGKFKNAKKIYDKIIEKMLVDDDFYNFCKFYNKKQQKGKYGYTESKFEIFLGIFNENRFSDKRNEILFENR